MYTIKTEENPKPTYMEHRFIFTCEQQKVVKNDFYAARGFILEAGLENFQLDETDPIQAKMKKTVLKVMEKNNKTPVAAKPATPVEVPNPIDQKPAETKAAPVETPVNNQESSVFINHYTDGDGTEITVVTNAPEYCNPLIIK